jgi:hypothetical protein
MAIAVRSAHTTEHRASLQQDARFKGRLDRTRPALLCACTDRPSFASAVALVRGGRGVRPERLDFCFTAFGTSPSVGVEQNGPRRRARRATLARRDATRCGWPTMSNLAHAGPEPDVVRACGALGSTGVGAVGVEVAVRR